MSEEDKLYTAMVTAVTSRRSKYILLCQQFPGYSAEARKARADGMKDEEQLLGRPVLEEAGVVDVVETPEDE